MSDPPPKIPTGYIEEFLHFEYLRQPRCPQKSQRNICQMMMLEDLKRLKWANQHSKVTRNESADSSDSGVGSSRADSEEPPSKRRKSGNGRTPAIEIVHDSRALECDSDDDGPADWLIPPGDPDDNTLHFFNKEVDDEVIHGIGLNNVKWVFNHFTRGGSHAFGGAIYFSRPRKFWIENAFHMINLHIYEQETPLGVEKWHIFNDIKVTIGYGKIKILLKDTKRDPGEEGRSVKFEYWQAVNGCLTWYNEQTYFVEGISYETLAATEFMKIITSSVDDPMTRLEFDMEERTKWDPMEYHRPYFIQKIKRAMLTPVGSGSDKKLRLLPITEFSMRMPRSSMRRKEPFKLRFLDPKHLKKITLRTWDDSEIYSKPPKSLSRKQSKFQSAMSPMRKFTDTVQWKSVETLDLADEAFWGTSEHFCHCRNVYLLKTSVNDVLTIMQHFNTHTARKRRVAEPNNPDSYINPPLTIHVKSPIRLEQFRERFPNPRRTTIYGSSLVAVKGEVDEYEMFTFSDTNYIVVKLEEYKFTITHHLHTKQPPGTNTSAHRY